MALNDGGYMEPLQDYQLETFDQEYITHRRWQPVKRCIDRDFPDGQFTFLDVGGGNGLFADRILEFYPKAQGVVYDISHLLLSRNKPHPRKHLRQDSAEHLAHLKGEKFDLICANWLLHHLVGKTYQQSRTNIERALRDMRNLLNERGRISIYENIYNGILFDALPSRIVYFLTSAKAIKSLIRWAGANTAGVGVCFLSYPQWLNVFTQNGFRVLDHTPDKDWYIPWTWRVFLHIGQVHCAHFWLV
ncbi:MAG: class I SAM-dependent methyltransferase [Planctomycetota bacterium]|nr:class I SAM-dependent methyltransferase [Planctomycetota bacterium]